MQWSVIVDQLCREQFAAADVQLLRFDHRDAPTNPEATAHLRLTVKDPDATKVGRRFSSAVVELALGGYAGFHTTTPPGSESSYGVYWPALVPASEVRHAVVLPHADRIEIPLTPTGPRRHHPVLAHPVSASFDVTTVRAPLGTVCGARSGDKGGNANIGLWTKDDRHWAWLRQELTVARLRTLLPEAAALKIRRYELPNLRALNSSSSACSVRALRVPPDPTPRPKAWVRTCAHARSTYRRAS